MLVPMPVPGSNASPAATTRSTVLDWVGLACRLVLGGVLVVAGALKVTNLESSVLAVRGYQLLPYEVALVVGYMLPLLEIIVGLLLIAGLLTRFAGAIGALLMVAFIIGISSAWARGISIDCGCFGGGGEIALEEAVKKYPVEIARDIGLAAAGIWLLVRPDSKFSLDRGWLGTPAPAPLTGADDEHDDPADTDEPLARQTDAAAGGAGPAGVTLDTPSASAGTKSSTPDVESTDVAPTDSGTKEDLTR